jgi:carbamoyltransferase
MAKVRRFEHHACHAAGAYYGQGELKEDVLVMTCDGGGDGICCSVNIGRGGRLERLATIPVEDSIAKLYALITCMMGLVPLEHEYKVMGLAPYADGKSAEELADYLAGHFEWDEDPPRWRRKGGLPSTAYWRDIIYEKTEFQRFDIVAGGFQRFIERMMVRWVRGWLRKTGIKRLALSGGIFMNVKMNKLLMELDEVDSIYVLPSCGDESNPIGACYLAAVESGAAPGDLVPLGPLYLGPRYTEADIQRAIDAFARNSQVIVKRHDVIEGEVAKLLAGGEIVARYNGREEFGARALGNRSILADPSRLDLIRDLNQMIKCRDFWMPFAGTMTESQAERNLFNPKGVPAPYMIMTFDSTANYEDYRAATHPYDRTIRPQVLRESWNPSYHRVLIEFERQSGKRAGLLNTSFNLHGYPIVSSPEDALDVFNRSGLVYLSMGSYLLSKRTRG